MLQAEKCRATLAAPKGVSHYEQIKQTFVSDQGLAPIDSDIQLLRNCCN